MLKEGQERIEKTQQEQGKKLDNLEKTQQEQGKKLDNLDKKVDQRTSDIIDLFRDTWKYFDKQGAEIKAEIHA